jgi:hypothetical protein
MLFGSVGFFKQNKAGRRRIASYYIDQHWSLSHWNYCNPLFPYSGRNDNFLPLARPENPALECVYAGIVKTFGLPSSAIDAVNAAEIARETVAFVRFIISRILL